MEDVGKTIQSNLEGFRTGVTNLSANIDSLAKSLETMKKLFASEQKINLDVNDKEAIAKLTNLEEVAARVKRMLETPTQVALGGNLDTITQQLLKEHESLTNAEELLRVQRQQNETIKTQLKDTNKLVALSDELLIANASYSYTAPAPTKVGKTVNDMNPDEVQAVNDRLKDRENVLANLEKAYQAAGQVFPEFAKAEQLAVAQALIAFKNGADKSVVYTQEIAAAAGTNEELIKQFSTTTTATTQRASTAIATSLQTIIPEMLKASQELKTLSESKNIPLSVRQSASSDVTSLLKNMEGLNTELGKVATSGAMQILIDQMGSYRQELSKSKDASTQATQAEIKGLDDNIATLTKLKDSQTATYKEKIAAAQKVNDAYRMTLQKDTDAQELKVKASPTTAIQAAKDNTEIAKQQAQNNPVSVPVNSDKAQATKAGVESAQAVKAGAASTPPIEKSVDVQINQAQVSEKVQQVNTTVAQSKTELPIKVNTSEVVVASSEVLQLKEKISSIMALNSSGIKFLPPGTSQEIYGITTSLKSLLTKKDELGNIKIDVKDQTLTKAFNAYQMLIQSANTYYKDFVNGTNSADTQQQALLKTVQDTNKAVQSNPTPSNFAAAREAKAAYDTYGSQLDNIRTNLKAVKKEESDSFSLNMVPTNSIDQLQTVSTLLTNVSSGLRGMASNQSADQQQAAATAAWADKLNELKTELTQFQDQAKKGITLDPAALDNFEAKFTSTMNAIKGAGLGNAFDPTQVQQSIGVLDQLKGILNSIPKMKVDADTTQIDSAINKTNQLLQLDGRKASIDMIVNIATKQQGGGIGFNTGGLVGVLSYFAKGGLAQVQHLANGGKTIFKQLANRVPGVGSGDKVPAMLEPGEFIIRKSMVQRYGSDFMSSINQGLLQFKALGGHVFNMPSQALTGLQQYVIPQYPIPNTVTDSGSVDVHLHLAGKVFNMKSSRDQIKDLVNAAKTLDRGY